MDSYPPGRTMAANDPDDTSFADAMARMGVEPLGRGRGRARPGRAKSKPTAKSKPGRPSDQRRPPEPSPRGPAPSRAGRESERKPSTPPGRAPDEAPTEQAPGRQRQAAQAAQAEFERARREWAQERAQLEARVERVKAELLQLQEHQRAATKASERRERELRQDKTRLAQSIGRLRPLNDVLRARGCADRSEAAEVLRRLLEVRPKDVLAALGDIDPGPLAALLDERVAFVARSVDLESSADCVVIHVPPQRCEVTGGSDIRAAFNQLRESCARATITQLTIVGGSPAYRSQLRDLARRHDDAPALNLVSGTRRRSSKRAEADMRSSDLVIIWGASELDHSVSAVYARAPDKTLYAPHRGISRMLLHVAEAIGQRR